MYVNIFMSVLIYVNIFMSVLIFLSSLVDCHADDSLHSYREKNYEIEGENLERKYKDWQRKLHPDLVHTKSQVHRIALYTYIPNLHFDFSFGAPLPPKFDIVFLWLFAVSARKKGSMLLNNLLASLMLIAH